jgi:hypothetical protein
MFPNNDTAISSDDLVELTAQIGQRLLQRNKELEDVVQELQQKVTREYQIILIAD